MSRPTKRAPGLGDDPYTDDKVHIYNPQDESPNPMVTAKEDRDRPSSKPWIFETIGRDPTLPVRPGFGTEGYPVELRTNHFALSLDLEKTMYRYRVDITDPEINGNYQRKQFFSMMFDEIDGFRWMKGRVATDHAETLITAGKLNLGVTKEIRLKYHEKGQLPRSNTKASRVVITLSGPVPTAEMMRYLDSVPGDSTDLESRLTTIQAPNIVVNATPNTNPTVFQPRRNVFAEFPRNSNPSSMEAYRNVDLSRGLIGVRSYYSSVKTATARILLNLRGQCSPFYPELNLLSLMKTFSPDRKDPFALEKFIKKLRIRFRFLEDKKQQPVKTVYGFSHVMEKVKDEVGRPETDTRGNPIWRGNADCNYGSSESIKFQSSKYPHPLTVAEYFRKEHGITLKDPEAIVVNFGSDTNPVWIPAELGVVEPGQPFRGKLNDKQTSNILAIAARGPAENARRLMGAGTDVIGIHANDPVLVSTASIQHSKSSLMLVNVVGVRD
ncbi:MAG: hypothetical protein Q9221_004441 [Calogaya cf. arnoldii]